MRRSTDVQFESEKSNNSKTRDSYNTHFTQMVEDEMRKRERDRRYVKFKMKRIKEARNKGNKAAAQRHSTELIQYLGIAPDDSETPIEGALDPLE